MSGEIEHAMWSAWNDEHPDVIIIEGQGSLLNPAYPGGYEILAAARPDVVVLQHAPTRTYYDGFPDHPIHPLDRQILAIQVVSDSPVVAITVSHENLTKSETTEICMDIARRTGLPTCAPLREGLGEVLRALAPQMLPGPNKSMARSRQWTPASLRQVGPLRAGSSFHAFCGSSQSRR